MVRRPTLNDVVEQAGLSIFTVSRALSGAPGVSEASRKKVLTAAEAIGYIPNKAARELRSQVPGPVLVMTASTSNYYYIDMIDGIQAGLREAGVAMRFVDLAPAGRFDPATEDAAVEEALQSRAAGVISTLTLSTENYERMTKWGIPTVFVDSKAPESELGVASVTTDNIDATRQIGEHLAFHSLEQWVLLIYPHLWSTRAVREEGLLATAAARGSELTILECENDPNSAREVLGTYLEGRPATPFGLIAGNNPLLHGSLLALRHYGLKIPDEVAVIAFDEFAWAPLLSSPATVVDEDSRAIGELAARKLTQIIARHSGGNSPVMTPRYLPTDQEEVKAQLLIRQSCGCP